MAILQSAGYGDRAFDVKVSKLAKLSSKEFCNKNIENTVFSKLEERRVDRYILLLGDSAVANEE